MRRNSPKNGTVHRRTPQLDAILRVLIRAESHITAEQIHQEARKDIPGMSLSTVYRRLERLMRRGLVTETDIGDHRVVYHAIEKGRHHHLVCRICGRTMEIADKDLDALRENLRREYDFAPIVRHLAVFGQCAGCRNAGV